MDSTFATVPLRYMTFNLCNIPQMDKDKAYNGLRFEDRLEKIVSVISTLSPDVIGFQEVRDYTKETGEKRSVMADLWGKLGPLNYRLQCKEGSPHELAVYNVIAYKVNKVWPKTVTAWWNSATPNEVSCSYGNGWPRAVLAAEFIPVKQVTVCRQKQDSDAIVTFNRPAPDYSSPSLLLVNSHLGLGIGTSDPKERVFSNQTTLEKIQQLVGSQPTFVVSLGDFNAFPDGKFFEEEMNVYNSNGFTDGVTSLPLKNQDGVPVSGTFIGFTPDPHRCSDNKFGSSLSRMWYKIFNLNQENSSWNIMINKCFAVTLTGDQEFDSRKIEQESDLLKGPDGSTLRDKYPSDHLPVILDFELKYRQSK